MIILDTNVVSELMKKEPDQNVLNWSRIHSSKGLAITTLTVFEIRWGMERLPEGTKRQQLETAFAEFLSRAFSDRILVFDAQSAAQAAILCRIREKNGLHAHQMDLMIAGIAKTNNALIATRNKKDFDYCGLDLIDPWNPSS